MLVIAGAVINSVNRTPSRYRSAPEVFISDNLLKQNMPSKVAMFYVSVYLYTFIGIGEPSKTSKKKKQVQGSGIYKTDTGVLGAAIKLVNCTPSRYRFVPKGCISENLPRRYMTSKVAMFYSYNVPLHGYMCWRAGQSSY